MVHAHVFRRSDTGWHREACVKASNTEAFGFGRTLALSGDTLVVGASQDSRASGAFYVFQRVRE